MARLALVFDLDDTLAPWRAYALSGFQAVDAWLRAYAGAYGFWEQIEPLFEGGEREQVIGKALSALGNPRFEEDAFIQKAIRIYRSHTPQIHLYEDVPAFLGSASQCCALGIITDGIWEVQARKLEVLGLGRWVSCAICTDGLEPPSPKPAPQAFLQIQEKLGVRPEDCVYIGDNPFKDFKAPRALGWKTVRIYREQGEYISATPPGPAYQADAEITHLGELEGLFSELSYAARVQ